MSAQTRDSHILLAERLLRASHVCALTGAGISKESGVPTFRDKDGLWNRFRPEELANAGAFLSNPQRVWEWYAWRRELMAKVQPNPGHLALAELERLIDRFVLITQNVDDLHRIAGSIDILELHGNIHRNKCQLCQHVFGPGESEANLTFEQGTLPVCTCGKKGLLRPDVVWFGEMLPEAAIERAWEESSSCDLFLSIGTSAIVYPAAALPQQAKAAGAMLVEINPHPTELTPLADLVIREPSGVALPIVIRELRALQESN